MEGVFVIGLNVLWVVVMVNLMLTLRAVRLLRSMEEVRDRDAEMEELPELSVGAPAPAFRAKELSGERVGLGDYAGCAVVFVFVSPQCGQCRLHMPELIRLGERAREEAGIELTLVSDSGTAETYTWINTIAEEDDLETSLPFLVAPRTVYDFLVSYNPRGFSPYFCYIDEQSIVQARGVLGESEWAELKQQLEGLPTPRSSSQSLRRYK